MAELKDGQGQQSQQGQIEVGSFFSNEGRILNDIAGGSVFNFRRGKNWSIDPETGNATYDPKFFEEQGYTPSQALFASFHELRCHLVETAQLLETRQGQREYSRLKSRSRKQKWRHIWDNCRTDAKGNLAIVSFAPSLTEDTRTLYREKLFPETDLTDKPKHLQFMYAVLRQAMLPGEEVVIDPAVQEAIGKLRDVKGRDVIDLATNPRQNPLLALQLSRRYIEPVIEELYTQDLEDKKNESQDGESGQGEGAEGEGAFAEDYEDYEKRHPEPFGEDEKELEKKIKETIESQDATSRKRAGYEEEHGVSHKDVASYYQEYKLVEPYIEPLREIFRRIVEQRLIPKEHLESLKEEGIMVDPGLIVQTNIESQVGVENPRTMMDFEGRFIEENIPGKFSLRLVADQSGSMAGEKAVQQRRAAILVMEALKEFSDMLGEENLTVDLDVETELRSFGYVNQSGTTTTHSYKPLSKELTEQQRIDYFNGLLETPGAHTNDYEAVSDIEKDIKAKMAQDPLYAQELASGKRREIVIVLTDGDSNDETKLKLNIKKLREMGVKVVGLGMTKEAQSVSNVYSPDGRICEEVRDLPTAFKEMLEEYLDTLFIK